MTGIENEAEIIPKKLSFTSSIGGNRSRTTSIIDNFAVDVQTSISPVIPTVINESDENKNDGDVPVFSIRKIYKNLIILSIAFLLIFTAYVGILLLQSSLNTKGNVGVNSLIVMNVFIMISSIFLTGITMDIFGLKWTVMIGQIGNLLYICANIRPTPTLMYITAAFLGLATSPLWTAQANYIKLIARCYAHHKQKKVADIVSLFFGIFFAIFGTCGIWGNLISYLVLNQSNHPQKYNCGVYFDPLSKNHTDESEHVSDLTRYVLCGTLAGIGILSIVLLFFLLDQIRLAETQPFVQSLKKGFEVIQSFLRWKHIDQLFLVPITVWSMIEVSFIVAQFTRAFVTCLAGIRFVGLVMVCSGVCNAIASYIFGALVKYIGRVGCFIIAAAFNYASIMLMYFWNPLEEQMYILFIIAGLWGTASAAWQSQVIATYTVLYSETDSSAIAKYRFWKSVGSLVTYGYASYITIELTLIILFSCLTVSMICYGVVEIHSRWKSNAKKKSDLVVNHD